MTEGWESKYNLKHLGCGMTVAEQVLAILESLEVVNTEQVKACIGEALAELPEAVSVDEVKTCIEEALGELPEAVTPDAVKTCIEEALAELPEAVTVDEVKTCIEEALAELSGPDGSAVFGVVDADGNITLPDGSTAPAVDGQGNPIAAGEPVLSIFDGDGNYLGSKLCNSSMELPTKEGVFDPSTNKLLTELTNPFVEYNCIQGGIELTRCDGSGVCLVPTQRGSVGTQANVFNLTTTSTAADLEANTFSCVDITIPKCGPHGVQIINTTGYQMREGYQGAFTIQFVPQFSIDGGATWQPFGSGGIDGMANIPAMAGGFASSPEYDFTDYAGPQVPSGLQTICTRTTWPVGTINAGFLQVNTQTFRVDVNSFKCCPIDATP